MKKLKYLPLLLAVLMMTAVFAGCDKSSGGDTLVLGTSADYAPYEFHTMIDGKDTIVGFDIELAKAIAADMGKELVIKDIAFESLVIELANETVDMIIAGMGPSPERDAAATYSDVYYYDDEPLLLIRASDADKFKSFADFAGCTVAGQVSTTKEALITKYMPDAQVLSMSAVPDMISSLLYNKCDAALVDGQVGLGYIAENPDLIAAPVDMTEDAEKCMVLVKKDDPKGLLADINKTIARVTGNGELAKWVEEAGSYEEIGAE